MARSYHGNLRIISATADRMGLTPDKVMINIEKYGNTTAGYYPDLSLRNGSEAGKIK